MNYNLLVDQNEAQLILNALVELPYKMVAPTVAKLHGQVTQQEEDAKKEPGLKAVPSKEAS